MATDTPPKARRGAISGPTCSGSFVIAGVAVVALWDWDWFIPLLDRQASSALGRKTHRAAPARRLGPDHLVTMDGVQIASSDGYPADKPFATADKLTVAIDVMAYVHSRQIVIPQITVDKPVVDAEEDAKGEANWPAPQTSSSSSAPADPKAGPRIGELVINDGKAHVVLAKLKADFNLDVATRAGASATKRPPRSERDAGRWSTGDRCHGEGDLCQPTHQWRVDRRCPALAA